MATTISVRALDAHHDPMYGQGQSNFLTDIDAVAQIIQTRLLLLKGEWWANLDDGLPVLQEMLGVGGAGLNSSPAALAIQQTIAGSPYVTSVSNVQTIYNPTNRSFSFSCTVTTAFGELQVSSALGSQAALPT